MKSPLLSILLLMTFSAHSEDPGLQISDKVRAHIHQLQTESLGILSEEGALNTPTPEFLNLTPPDMEVSIEERLSRIDHFGENKTFQIQGNVIELPRYAGEAKESLSGLPPKDDARGARPN